MTGRFGGRPVTGQPVITWTLIGLNLLVYVVQRIVGGDFNGEVGLWPPGVAQGDFYRLVSSMFLHYGEMHLLANMMTLYIIGRLLEEALGRWRYSGLYVLSGLGGSVLVYLISPLDTLTGGASGAIYGLLGAMFVLARRTNMEVRGALALVVFNVAFSVLLPVSWQGHLGGAIAGVVVAAAYVYAPKARRTAIQAAATVAMLLVFAALIWWRTETLRAQFGIG